MFDNWRVCRGRRGTFPQGSYIYGDYCSGEIIMWHNNAQTTLLDTALSIVGFAEDQSGELYVIDQSGTIDRIIGTAARKEEERAIPVVRGARSNGRELFLTHNGASGCKNIYLDRAVFL